MKTNMKRLISSTLSLSILAMTVQTGFAQNYNYTPPQNSTTPGANYSQPSKNTGNYQAPQQFNVPKLQGHVIIIPQGTVLSAVSPTKMSSDFLTVGDSVSLTIGTPFYFQGAMIAPANSIVNGSVVIAEKAGRGGKHGKLKVKFTDIITPQGVRIPIAGKIQTQDGTGVLVGGTNKERAVKAAKNTAVGAAGGALSGLIFGAASGGKAGKGAAVGTAIGSGLGLGKSLWDKGVEASIPPGSAVDIILEQPVTINPSS